MAMSEAQQRFAQAVYLLATGQERIQERLAAAWVEVMPLRRDDIPVALREAFAAIQEQMLNAPDDPEALSDEVAVTAAERLVLMELQLRATAPVEPT